MKKLFFTFMFLLCGIVAFSQPKLLLATNEHDFGVFKEEAGRQTFDFLVTNPGDSALVIHSVVPSCGCTTPVWTQTPIPPKGKGKITAIYDPANRPGQFIKTLSVHTNSIPEMVVLVIKGEVTPHEKTIEELFPWLVGGVRFESSQLAFTNVKKNEKKMRVMQIINTLKVPAKIEFDAVPAHIGLKANPETLKPDQKGIIEGTYDATKKPEWGNVNDMVKVKINGVVIPDHDFYVLANLVEDFSGLTKDEILNAPVFQIASTILDIGIMEPNTVKDLEFKFTNAGKRDLIIRHIRATCGCTSVLQNDTPVKPGETRGIKASFNSGAYTGKVTKAIYVYTNDPKSSEVILFLNAEIPVKNQ